MPGLDPVANELKLTLISPPQQLSLPNPLTLRRLWRGCHTDRNFLASLHMAPTLS